jgi:hypothetical protein
LSIPGDATTDGSCRYGATAYRLYTIEFSLLCWCRHNGIHDIEDNPSTGNQTEQEYIFFGNENKRKRITNQIHERGQKKRLNRTMIKRVNEENWQRKQRQ